MKKIFFIMVAIVFLLKLFPGCVNPSKQEQEKETPIGVKKQHDTRVVLICKTNNGQYLQKSLHISESVNCGNAIFKLEDFVKIKTEDSFISFPGQENELKKYLIKKKK